MKRLIATLAVCCTVAALLQPNTAPPGSTQALDGNPFNRSEAKRPSRIPKLGKEANEGSLAFLLVTSFLSESSSSGKVWVVPVSHPKSSFVLVSGLHTPTGVCYDRNHEFLYVCDVGLHAVLQFEINSDGQFTLATDQVATVYLGTEPTGCSVDGFGNLYIVETAGNSIELVNSWDLWSGYAGRNMTLYSGYGTIAGVGRPIGIAVQNSASLYFLNSDNQEDFGLINTAHAQTYRDIDSLGVLLRGDQQPQGLALSKELAYFTAEDGTVWAYQYQEKANLYLKSVGFFTSPRGVCSSDGRVFIADSVRGEVFWFADDHREEVVPTGLVRLAGAYGLACISF